MRCLSSCGTSIDACNRIRKEIVKKNEGENEYTKPNERASEWTNEYNNRNNQRVSVREYRILGKFFSFKPQKMTEVAYFALCFSFLR